MSGNIAPMCLSWQDYWNIIQLLKNEAKLRAETYIYYNIKELVWTIKPIKIEVSLIIYTNMATKLNYKC